MPDIQGNISGIRDTYLRQLETLYDYAVESDIFLPPDLAHTLADFSARINREIAVYISRGGQIIDVTIGYLDNVALQDMRLRRSQERLSMVRCIHTHPGGSAELSDVDITALKTLWLDAMSAIGVDANGTITGVSAGFLASRVAGVPQPLLMPVVQLEGLPQEAWMRQILISDEEVMGGEDKLMATAERALLVSTDSQKSLDELEALCDTAGATVVGRFLQIKNHPDPSSYVGSGKAGELALEAQALGADILITDDELTSSQHSKLEELSGVRVVDRTTLILDIFAQRAKSSEGKLQVELAQLKYRSRHLRGAGMILSRQTGGIGTRRGPGETKLEIDRRLIRERIGILGAELDKMERQRAIRRKSRQKSAIPVVALVGYTNTGKSTLLNKLADADVYVEDKLFATLDAVNRKMTLPDGDSFILVDTVGFINKLPTELIEAFHSTLEEATLADILVIVSDFASPDYLAQHKVVQEVLAKLEALHQPRIEVLNKADAAQPDAFPLIPGAIPISAKTGEGLDLLLDAIAKLLRARERAYDIFVPFSQYSLLSDMRALGRILSEEHQPEGSLVWVMLDKPSLGKLEAKYGGLIQPSKDMPV